MTEAAASTPLNVNPVGGSGRGTFCTPKWLADLIGPVDVDPCSNVRSHVVAAHKFFGASAEDDGLRIAPQVAATALVYVNPPFNAGEVTKWVRAYTHTNFMFMLRFDPSTSWFKELLEHTHFIWFPYRSRINFEPPPGVKVSSNPFPHGLYCKSRPSARLLAHGYTLEVTEELRKSLAAYEIKRPVTDTDDE